VQPGDNWFQATGEFLKRCLKKLERGGRLIVWKLDRLGRSLRDLIAMLDDLKHRGAKFRALTEAIDTGTPIGRAMWQMIGVVAELERSLIKRTDPRRREDGAGRPRQVCSEEEAYSGARGRRPEEDHGGPFAQACSQFYRVSRATLYRASVA
jgi:hypothetical protein